MTTDTPPMPAKAPADCCVVSADPRVPPPAPVVVGHVDLRLLAGDAPAPVVLTRLVQRCNDRDARARSADRPPLVAVLLI